MGFGGVQREGGSLPGVQIPISTSTAETTLIECLLVSDIFSTAWSSVTFSGFKAGDSVAVFGAGPVSLLAAYSAILRGVSRVYSVDQVQERLDLTASIGAFPINFNASDPVKQVLARELGAVNATGDRDAAITLRNMVSMTARQGGIRIVGIFNATLKDFDIGSTFEKALSVSAGIVLRLRVAGELVPLIASGQAHPSFIVSSVTGIEEAPEYYARFSQHRETKVLIRFQGYTCLGGMLFMKDYIGFNQPRIT
ncbi:NAD(P)-binding protein [Plenodomus tracheiphilus IPT5]|uniref:NAD(P)-binding protein n=1 Tax=Plenodomus tracheiphilus IPT5 TaxID=1408161 RepID=A0A6A7AYL0_9PLEO|nr:NAD(P)-binding protein [Plenodomus tracheiphilus IPT5]